MLRSFYADHCITVAQITAERKIVLSFLISEELTTMKQREKSEKRKQREK
jgi:hypothetical protein